MATTNDAKSIRFKKWQFWWKEKMNAINDDITFDKFNLLQTFISQNKFQFTSSSVLELIFERVWKKFFDSWQLGEKIVENGVSKFVFKHLIWAHLLSHMLQQLGYPYSQVFAHLCTTHIPNENGSPFSLTLLLPTWCSSHKWILFIICRKFHRCYSYRFYIMYYIINVFMEKKYKFRWYLISL